MPLEFRCWTGYASAGFTRLLGVVRAVGHARECIACLLLHACDGHAVFGLKLLVVGLILHGGTLLCEVLHFRFEATVQKESEIAAHFRHEHHIPEIQFINRAQPIWWV